ncbi:MAG: DUF2007 domain-containing protein [Flavobacterium sp.]|uniref:putative signal transducing protein n=1 Tax=Flavobacterium sp. TaxID=239 RepID=UPI00120B5FDE|nr:DUF2007 domain-containing protein [Flavobacterium sp.]RZJ68526.1 MAG: DUF2007 domain-containing protein [Flavobacterium sp.]
MEPQFSFLATYTYSSEAQIFKGLLESHGIEVFIRDNHTVDADPLVSNAVGGVKLFVRTEDLDMAKDILGEVRQYSVDEYGQPITCPECGAQKADLVTSVKEKKTLFAVIASFLIGGLPLYTNYHYKCANCGHEFGSSLS